MAKTTCEMCECRMALSCLLRASFSRFLIVICASCPERAIMLINLRTSSSFLMMKLYDQKSSLWLSMSLSQRSSRRPKHLTHVRTNVMKFHKKGCPLSRQISDDFSHDWFRGWMPVGPTRRRSETKVFSLSCHTDVTFRLMIVMQMETRKLMMSRRWNQRSAATQPLRAWRRDPAMIFAERKIGLRFPRQWELEPIAAGVSCTYHFRMPTAALCIDGDVLTTEDFGLGTAEGIRNSLRAWKDIKKLIGWFGCYPNIRPVYFAYPSCIFFG